jgi:hypothetical protein
MTLRMGVIDRVLDAIRTAEHRAPEEVRSRAAAHRLTNVAATLPARCTGKSTDTPTPAGCASEYARQDLVRGRWRLSQRCQRL